MRRFINILMVVVFTFSNLPLSHFLTPDEPDLQAGIQDFGWLLNQLWGFEEFNQQVPLSNVTPAEVLHLDQLFSSAFSIIPLQVSMPLTTFELDGVEGKITVDFDPFESPKIATVELHAEKLEYLQISYLNQPEEHTNFTPIESGTCEDFINNDDDELLDGDDPDCAYITIIGGKVPTLFKLDTTLTFIEEEVGEGESVFYLAGNSPEIKISYSAADDQVFFDSRFNIADIEVGGSVEYNVEIEAQIIDENNDGKISFDDWTNSILDDLIQMDYLDGLNNDVDIDLTLSLDEGVFDTGEGEDFLSLSIPDLSAADIPEISLEPDGLKDFLTIDSDELLTGLGSYAVALDTMWIAGEGEIPFIEERFHNLSGSEDAQFLPGDIIRDFLKRQSDALVYCFTEELPVEQGADQKYDAYCQAYTPSEPMVHPDTGWALGDITPEYQYPDTLETTIGISPTGWAIFPDLGEDEWKNVQVTYFYPAATEEEDPEMHVVEPRIRSIGDLKNKLEQLSGMQPVEVDYASETKTLVFDIQQETAQDLAESEIHFAFGNQLQKYTGISNVHPSSSQTSSPSMGLTSVMIHAGFGTILVDDAARISPNPKREGQADSSCSDGEDNDGDGWVDMYDLDCPKLEDRFFIKANPNGPEIEVGDLTINVPDGYKMEGLIGAVDVTITVNPPQIDDSQFEITASPGLELSIIPSDIIVEDQEDPYSSFFIDAAIGVRELISNPCLDENGCGENLDQNISRVQTLIATGKLYVETELLGRDETVTINTANDPEITTDGTLQSLDIAPSVIGKHDGGLNPTDLFDDHHNTDFDFSDYFNVDLTDQVEDFVPQTIYNLSNGSSCTGFIVVDANTLQCSSPLEGNEDSEDNQWNPGDRYIIQGDPRALLTLVEDSLYSLAGELYNQDTGDDIPIMGMNMRDLVPQYAEVRNAITQIRNGDPSTEIFCEIIQEVVLEEGVEITRPAIICHAVSEFPPDEGSVSWVPGENSNLTCDENCNNSETVYLPDEDSFDTKVKFTVSTTLASSEDLNALSVSLTFDHDVEGESIPESVTYPYQQPQTLQEFKEAFEEADEERLNFSLDNGNLEVTFIDGPLATSQGFPLRAELETTDDDIYYLVQLDDDPAQLEETPPAMLTASIDSYLALQLGIPLDKHVPLQNVEVLDGTSVEVSVSIDQTDFNITASLGGSEVVLNTDADLPVGGDIELGIGLQVGGRDSSPLFYDSLDETVVATFTMTNMGNNELPFDIYDSAGNLICTIDALPPSCTKPDYTVSTLPDFVFAQKSFPGFSIQSQPVSIAVPPRLDLEVTTSSLVYDPVSGTDITVTYTLTNNGGEDLLNVTLRDDNDLEIICDTNPIANLASGETDSCTKTYNVDQQGFMIDVQAKAEIGPVQSSNSTTMCSGLSPDGDPILGASTSCEGSDKSLQQNANSPANGTVYPLGPGDPVYSQRVQFTFYDETQYQPSLQLETYPGYPLIYSSADNIIEIPIKLTNNGNVAVTGPYNIVEEINGDLVVVGECIPLDDPASALAVLTPDQSKTCVLGYQVTANELADPSIQKTFQVKFNNDEHTSNSEVLVEAENISYQAITVSITKELSLTDDPNQTLSDFNTEVNIIAESYQFLFNMLKPDGGTIGRVGPAYSYPIPITEAVKGALDLAPMELSLVTYAFDMLGDLLEQNLDADRWDYMRVPLAGSDLSVGIDFVEVFSGLSQPLEDFFADVVTDSSTLSALCNQVVDDPDILVSTKFEVTAEDGAENEYTCSSIDPGDSETNPVLNQIVEIKFQLKEDYRIFNDSPPIPIPFDIGLPGVPLESTDNDPIVATNTYTLNPIIGLNRSGPYFKSENDTSPILTLDSTLSMNPNPGHTCLITNTDFPVDVTDVFDEYITNPPNSHPCMEGVIGLLKGTLYDTGSIDSPSVEVNLNLSAGKGIGEFGYANYLYGSGLPEPELNIGDEFTTGQIDLLFKTTAPVLPTIVGEISLGYSSANDPADRFHDLRYDNIFMNVDYTEFMGPAVQEVQKYTKPIQPVVDTLTSPLPVISDLSTMVGQNPISLMSIMQAVPSNKLTMITRLAELIGFVNSIPASTNGIWLGLGGETAGEGGEEEELPGWLNIDIETVLNEECAKSVEETGDFDPQACDPNEKYKKLKETAKANKNKKFKEMVTSETSAEANWEGAGITMPILSDTTQIYGLLLGIDATLIRVDLGTLSASAGMEFTYGPFLVGPVPVSISIGGTVTLEGRFAMGFDTLGLRSTLRGDSFSMNDIADGIFIDDLDSSGSDVPEIRLGVEIYAGAAVSIRIIEAGIRAGVTFDVYLNWNDPNHDGKLRFDEIGIWAAKPICLFDRRGEIGFYLEFYLKFDFWLFSTTISWRPVNEKFTLFDESCEPPEPILAVRDDDDLQLKLYMGTSGNRNTRAVYTDEINEKFIVRQLTPRGEGCQDAEILEGGGPANDCAEGNGTWVSVTFQGIHQYFFLEDDGPEPGDLHYTIYAEAADGNDQISLLPGTRVVEDDDGNKSTEEVLFTLNAKLYGGSGNDSIDTGNGDDIVYGNCDETNPDTCIGNNNEEEDNDILSSRGGKDDLYGGNGIDSLDGGLGDDDLYGGGNEDIINGGPGTDYIFGGPGNDSLFGGPGLSDDFDNPELWDLTDYIIGGSGMDTIEGGFGEDYLFGDILAGIANADALRNMINTNPAWEEITQFSGTEDEYSHDKLIGGEDADYLFGGPGNDTLEGGKGIDELFGQEDHDQLMGGRGDDHLFGGAGHDWLQGDQGDDELYGDSEVRFDPQATEGLSEEVADVEGWDDDLIGGDGQDRLFGNGGNDILLGDNGIILDHDLLDGTPIEHRFNTDLVDIGLDDSLEGDHDGDESIDRLTDNETNFLTVFEVDPNQYIRKTIYNLTDGSACFGFIIDGTNTLICANELEGGMDNLWQAGDQYVIEAYVPVKVGTVYGVSTETLPENNQILIDSEINFLNLFGVEPGKEILKTIYNMSDESSCFGFTIVDEHSITCTRSLNDEADILWEAGDLYAIEGDTLANVQPETASTEDYPDYLMGGEGHDFMFGEGGSDTMYGDVGDDYMEGNAGDDRMDGNAGADNMLGGTEDDVMYGGGGWAYPDEIADNRDDKSLDGEDQADQMWGNSGNDTMYGNLGDDEMSGNTGNDYIEGNAGSDTIRGGPGDDDILGGRNEKDGEGQQLDTGDFLYGDEGMDYIEGNAGSDTIYGGPGDDDILGGSNEAGEADTGDLLYGDEGADTILGDNGEIIYIGTPDELVYQLEDDTSAEIAPFHTASGISSSRINREVVMLDTAPGDVAGSDWIEGGAGDDQIFGQFDDTDPEQSIIGDTLLGQEGQDLIVGDQGTATCSENTGENQEVLRTNAPFLIDDIFVANTLHCVATLQPTANDGDDRISGGDNADWLFGVGGIDLINGDSGNDRIFGGFGDDHIWGGPHHDHLWGGDGEDYLDVHPREEYTEKVRGQMVTVEADPPIYFEWAGEEPMQGIDYMYGGLGRDAMQADVSGKGRNPGDRMVDWIGVYNIYYLCSAQYGESVITRSPSPQVINFLVELARSDGAADPSVSGYDEIAIVYRQDYKDNSHPPHDDTPGHFTCVP